MTIDEAHDPTEAPFSDVMRTASQDVHQRAERSAFMRRLLAGEASVGEYADMLAQHYFAYCVLEEAAAALDDDVAIAFASPELDRRASLENDLHALLGVDWSNQIVANPGTEAYVDRLRAVCFHWPAGFVAHHYVRYLGDLSGGQIIRRILARTYEFVDGRGLSFYTFDRIGNAVQFKQRYRTMLDIAPWGEDERRRVVDEVIVAFELNGEVLDHLGPRA